MNMHIVLLIISILILLSVLTSKVLYRFGVPSLLIFLVLGMLSGTDGIGGIEFDNFQLAENISTLAIVVIMFYGGFGTKWSTAKPIAVKAGLLSSLGTIITALITGLFCVSVLKVSLLYGFLFGAVVSSTDAASVFSILRSRKLNLKNSLAPLLEVESGSNDPFAYILTILVITVIRNKTTNITFISIFEVFFMQIIIAVSIGVATAFATLFLLKRLKLEIDGIYPIMLLAIVMFSYSICVVANGNGLLCVYVLGIIVGNGKFLNKVSMVNFFDGFSWQMQILLFFTLGLLSYPSRLITLIIPATLLSLAIIFVARPIAVFGILSWFKVPARQQLFVSWVGLRGTASIVFAITAVSAIGDEMPYDLFHLVFFVALFSILIQGTLTPFLSKKLDLVDSDENSVLKTFNDYFEETHERLFEYKVTSKDDFLGKSIVDSNIPEDILIIMIKRGSEIILPKGYTELLKNDILVVSGEDFSFFNKTSK